MRRFLSPKRIRLALQGLKSVRAGGGPSRIKLVNVSDPKGLIPTSELTFEVEAQDGSVNRIQTAVPLPPLYTWGYRIARKLHLPLVSSLDPTKVHFDVKVPRRGAREADVPAGASR